MNIFSLLIVAQVGAQSVIYTYDSYYASLSGRVFKERSIVPAMEVHDGKIKWNGHRLILEQAKTFPGERAFREDLGSRPVAYRSGQLGCVEGQPSASSGTAVRHFGVYLIDARRLGRPQLFKLPSLFGSCTNVRIDPAGSLLFDDVDYRYVDGADQPNGVEFNEQRIRHGQFEPTGHKRSVTFIEQGNVWKFIPD